MRIKFIKSPTAVGFAYHIGEEASLPNLVALELIADGYARELKGKTDIPLDFPARQIFVEHGFTSLEEIKQIASIELLTAIQGIGRTTAQRIVKYF